MAGTLECTSALSSRGGAFWEVVTRSRNRFVGWVERRLIDTRPTTPAWALGGPHDPVDRSTHPTTDCGNAPSGHVMSQAMTAGGNCIEKRNERIALPSPGN